MILVLPVEKASFLLEALSVTEKFIDATIPKEINPNIWVGIPA